jgi:flagellar basal-body rod protein FlgG
MSVQTLYTAATGMESLQTKLDVIANNLANVNTTGFKAGRANFEDLFYRTDEFPGKQDAQGNLTAVGTQIGLGSRVASVQTDLRQGAFQETGEALDLTIEGQGMFRVTDPVTNLQLFTRAGNFSINAQGQLVIGSAQTGRLVDPAITFDQTTQAISISPDGQVFAQVPGQSQLSNVGTLQLAMFPNPEGLLKLGENLYAATDASGQEQPVAPGQQGAGVIRQGFLEASNVEPVHQLIDLITTQRSFELNSRAIQAGDQILQLISNLGRV